MIPTITAPGTAPPPVPTQSAQKSAQPQADTARSSAGETAAAALRAESTQAIEAPKQLSAAPRLLDEDSKERPHPPFDELVGPEPTFEESPLERQARVALDPPEIAAPPAQPESVSATDTDSTETDKDALGVTEAPAFEDPPPTPTERAEASFAETRTLAAQAEPATVDVAR